MRPTASMPPKTSGMPTRRPALHPLLAQASGGAVPRRTRSHLRRPAPDRRRCRDRGRLALLDSDDSFLRNQAVEILRARGARAMPFLDRAFRDGEQRPAEVRHRHPCAKLGDAGTSGIYDSRIERSGPERGDYRGRESGQCTADAVPGTDRRLDFAGNATRCCSARASRRSRRSGMRTRLNAVANAPRQSDGDCPDICSPPISSCWEPRAARKMSTKSLK